MKGKTKDETIDIVEINTSTIDCHLLGTTPIILHRMSEKAKYELLFPSRKKTPAERAASMKHDPIQEFRDSPYVAENKESPTYLVHLASSFKAAIRGAGVDMPGATKAQLGRLMWVNNERIPLYGLPKMFMSIVRQSGINRTPDVRTRAIIPRWACKISITYVSPMLNHKTVTNLLAAAGLTQGVGDWRPEKGSGNYGQFTLVNSDDKEWNEIAKIGYSQQLEAMESPMPYDIETEELMTWFGSELDRRGLKVVEGKR